MDRVHEQGRVADGLDLGGSGNGNVFAKVEAIDKQAVPGDRVDMLLAADQRHGRTGAGEHAAEIAADRSCPQNSD
jgi:hypothetical protein